MTFPAILFQRWAPTNGTNAGGNGRTIGVKSNVRDGDEISLA